MKPLKEMTLNERVKLYAEGDPKNGIHCHSFDFTKEDEPCPFCGGEARLQKHERVFIHGKTTRAAYVRCLQCNARTERVPYEEFGKSSYSADAHIKAVNAWNRRADNAE